MTRKKIEFEDALTQLNDNVKKLEEGSITLEESLKLFEESIKLSRFCSKYLTEAEVKIKKLVEGEMGIKFEDLDEE